MYYVKRNTLLKTVLDILHMIIILEHKGYWKFTSEAIASLVTGVIGSVVLLNDNGSCGWGGGGGSWVDF